MNKLKRIENIKPPRAQRKGKKREKEKKNSMKRVTHSKTTLSKVTVLARLIHTSAGLSTKNTI